MDRFNLQKTDLAIKLGIDVKNFKDINNINIDINKFNKFLHDKETNKNYNDIINLDTIITNKKLLNNLKTNIGILQYNIFHKNTINKDINRDLLDMFIAANISDAKTPCEFNYQKMKDNIDFFKNYLLQLNE